MTKKKLHKAIRWIAIVWSWVSIAFVLLFLIGYGLDPTESLPTGKDLLIMLTFPFGVITGLVIAWKWEFVGSIISIVGLGLFYLAIYLDKGFWPRGPFIVLVALPGFIFLLHFLLLRRHQAKVMDSL